MVRRDTGTLLVVVWKPERKLVRKHVRVEEGGMIPSTLISMHGNIRLSESGSRETPGELSRSAGPGVQAAGYSVSRSRTQTNASSYGRSRWYITRKYGRWACGSASKARGTT
jgi:hypothetical protein